MLLGSGVLITRIVITYFGGLVSTDIQYPEPQCHCLFLQRQRLGARFCEVYMDGISFPHECADGRRV